MLSAIGAASRAALIEAVVPQSIRRTAADGVASGRGEAEALAELKAIAAQNRLVKSFIGQGYHDTHTPGVILRNVSRTRPGTPPTRRTRRRYPRAGSRRC